MVEKIVLFLFSYIFDRMFYNDSSLPRTLKPPKYFEIKARDHYHI